MIEIDGSMGEGGGQIVRTALSLSLTTQRPIRLTNIRANRSRPGLRPQHVAAVQAAAAIGEAAVSEVQEGTRTLTFEPSTVVPGTYRFDVGTAGSAILVLQTVLLPLLTAPRSSRVTVTGGTHNRFAPPFDFFAATFLPIVERMGPTLRATLDRPGFYPKGGGCCTVDVQPVGELEPLTLTERGVSRPSRIRAIVANLPRHIAEREIATLQEALSVEIGETRIDTPSSLSAGNALLLELPFQHVTEVVSGIGEKGLPAEQVAMSVAEAAESYLDAEAPVGPHLADQLLLPLALGGGRFRTTALTAHTQTNAAVIERLLGECFSVVDATDGWGISASPHS